MINIVIIDDHSILAESLNMVIGQQDDFNVIGMANDGEKAIKVCEELNPDVVVMDVVMPKKSGIEALGIIKKNQPKVKVIMLTSMEDGKDIITAIQKVADAYILKDTPPSRLFEIIRMVNSGFSVMSDIIREKLVYNLESNRTEGINKQISFKEDEINIIRYISEGKTNREIAIITGYAEGTVKNKITKILEITECETRAQMVMYALNNNLLG